MTSEDGDPNQASIICATDFGITIDSNYNFTLDRLTFSNVNGTGIVLHQNSKLFIIESFLTNSNGIQGGAISAAANSLVSLNDAVISGNSAGRGGAIYAVDNAMIMNIGNTRIEGNEADDKGGAFYFINVNINWKQGIIIKNRAVEGGAFYCEKCKLDLFEIEMQLNIADERGGSFFIDDHTVSNMEHVELNDNHAEFQGGGIYCDTASTINLVQCSVDDNTYDNVYCNAGNCRIADDKHLCDCHHC